MNATLRFWLSFCAASNDGAKRIDASRAVRVALHRLLMLAGRFALGSAAHQMLFREPLHTEQSTAAGIGCSVISTFVSNSSGQLLQAEQPNAAGSSSSLDATPVFHSSGNTTLLAQMCALPLRFFVEPRFKAALLPALAAVVFRDVANLALMRKHVSPLHVSRFFRSHLKSVAAAADGSGTAFDSSAASELDARFPRAWWSDAVAFFDGRDR